MADWDAGRYHRLSDPQFGWGRRVLERLAPVAGERVLDIGCGTGRLTRELVDVMGEGHVVAVDRSEAMLKEASRGDWQYRGRRLHDVSERPMRVHFVRADAARLPFAAAFDAVFSTATFHWVADHDALFAGIYRVLAPGGRLVAQCGGGPNLRVLHDRVHRLMESREYRSYFTDWRDPWHYAEVPATMIRLERAGFSAVNVTLEPAPTPMPDAERYTDFLSCVCVRYHVARLPESVQPSFVAALTREAGCDDPPFTLDYWRLNISARKPAGAEQAA
ncbi:MAG TPA: methyltransferase domain-containing protein [Vicinamibacterales bacterium]|nr:methyltransferase domain-containing protein [Vicinamibacterales bacterium]